MAPRKPRTPGTARDVIGFIHARALDGHGPLAIKGLLHAWLNERGRVAEDPHINTIEKYARQMRESGPPWSRGEDVTGMGGRLLEIVAAVVERTEGRIRAISVREAAELARLIGDFPDIPPWDAFEFNRRAPTTRADPDLYLGFTPWRDGGRRYVAALRAGLMESVMVTTAIRGALADHIATATAAAALDQGGEAMKSLGSTLQDIAQQSAETVLDEIYQEDRL